MSNLHIVKKILITLTVLLAIFANSIHAEPNIEVESFWVVVPPEVARSTAGYGIIKNSGNTADTLIDIRSNAGSVMLHKTDINSGMARMTHMPYMIIEAKSELVLEPMSFHLMFSELCPLIFSKGEKVTLVFEFEQSGVIEIDVPLRTAW